MKLNIIAFLVLFSVNLQAQSRQSDSTTFLKKTDFKVGYFGNFVGVNGLNIGAEYLWREKEKVKEKRKGPKTITRQILLNGSLGYSTSFSNQINNGLSTYYGIQCRRISPKGWLFNLELSPLGYYRSFLPETFEVKGNEVSRVRFPGRSYYAPSFAIGTGKYNREKKHSGWYINFNVTLRTPYNAGTLPTFALHYGHRFNFKKK